ncbi:hypothetical protein [Marinobacter sp.]|uniref:hypothetical protein n=1 Tax=Marinobacter sp. TaxID=50741 RepID=UPI0035638056
MQAEAVRQFYLGMAGVKMWYAREPLPGAAPSLEYDLDEVPGPQVVPGAQSLPVAKPDPGQAARGRDKIAHLQSLMSTVESPSKKLSGQVAPPPGITHENTVAREAVASQSGSPDAAPVEVGEPSVINAPRLCMQAWRGSRFVLVANISEETSAALQETLAINILRSLGELSPVELGMIHWPLFNNLKISLNSEENLTQALATRYGDVSDQQVIVLGESPGWLEKALLKTPDVCFPGTLAKLASDSSLKRELWQMIKPLSEI